MIAGLVALGLVVVVLACVALVERTVARPVLAQEAERTLSIRIVADTSAFERAIRQATRAGLEFQEAADRLGAAASSAGTSMEQFSQAWRARA